MKLSRQATRFGKTLKMIFASVETENILPVIRRNSPACNNTKQHTHLTLRIL